MSIGRFFFRAIAGVAVVLIIVAAAVYWAGRSETALRWGIDRFGASLPCSLTVQGLQSGYARPVRAQYVVCENDDFRVEARNIALAWSPWRLASRQLHISSLQIDALNYTSKADGTKADVSQPMQAPTGLRLPISVNVASLQIASLATQSGDKALELLAVDAAYRGDANAHRLTLHNLESQWGRAAGEATIGATAPLPLAAKLNFTTDRLEGAPLSVDIALAGQLQNISATLEAMAGKQRASAKLELVPFDPVPVKSITAKASDIDAATFGSNFPHTAVAVTMQAKPVGNSALAGSLHAGNSISGTLDEQRLPLQRLDANFEFDMASLRLSDLRLDMGAAGKASGAAQLAPDRITLALDVSDLDLRAVRRDLRQSRLNGSISVDRENETQLVLLDLRQKDMRFEANAEVTAQRIVIKRVLAQSAGAQLRATATMDLDDRLGFSLDGALKRFDPARFGDFPQADINATVRVRGTVRPAWAVAVDYQLGRSRLAGSALNGSGTFQLSPTRLQAADVQLDYGGNHLSISGSFGDTDDSLMFVIDAKHLDRLDESLAGNVQVSGTLAGTMQRPAIQAFLKGQKIAVSGLRVEAADAQVQVDRAEDQMIRARAKLTRIKRGEFALDSVAAGVDGTLGSHAVDVAMAGPAMQLNGRFEGGWDKTRRVWSGAIARLENQGEYAFRMKRAAALELARNHLVIGATDVEFSQSEIKLGETRYQDGGLLTQGSISGVRAARLFGLMDKPPALESTLVLGARWEIRTDDTVNGFVELSRTGGDIVIAGEKPLALGLTDLRITLRAVANQITSEAVLRSAQIDAQGSAQTHLEKHGAEWRLPDTAALTLAGKLDMQTIRPLAALASRAIDADGRLSLTLKGSGTVAEPRLSGNVEGSNLKIEQFATGMMFEQGILRASFDNDALTLTEFRIKGGQGELTARGRFSARRGSPNIDLQWGARKLTVIQRPDMRLTVSGTGQLGYENTILSLKGELTADQGYVELRNRTSAATGGAAATAGRKTASPPDPGTQLRADAGVKPNAEVKPNAGVKLDATLKLDDKLGFSLDGALERFDPARFGALPQADINATVKVRGTLRPEWAAEVDYQLGQSKLTGVPLGGRGKFALSPARLWAADVRLDYGGNDLKLNGSFGNRGDSLMFALDAKHLDRLAASAAGTVQASGTLTGTIQQPAVKADISGQQLAYEDVRVGAATARISVEQADDPVIRAQASLNKVNRGTLALDSVETGIDGTLRSHAVELAVAAPKLQLAGRFDGGWDKAQRVWSGTIARFENEGEYAFKMLRPATLTFAENRVLLGATKIEFSQTEIEIGETRYENGSLMAQGTVSGVRAARLFALMDKPPAVESTLVLGARWEIRADETVNGFVELSRTEGDIIVPGEEPLALGLKELRVTLRAAANQINAEAILRSTQIDGEGSAQTRLEKRGTKWGVPGTAPLTLAGKLDMRSIQPLAALASRAVTADGRLRLEVKGNGTVAKPLLSGNVEGSNLKIEHVANGVFFDEGVLRASFDDDTLSLTEFRLKGGQGELSVSGRFSAHQGAPDVDLEWAARQLAVVQHPELRLTVSGAGKLGYKDTTLSLNGELTADQGRVELRNRTFPALGDDVVITGRETRAQLSGEAKPANLDLLLDLGPDFTVVGRGLNARMEGQIRLTSGADKPLSADGEIRVASGTFEAYGRRLQIEQGRLFFAGPVNNPGLNIRAMRKNQPVEAGVEVTGSARDPLVRLVSDPEVSDPNKLAWLVLGRPAETGNTQDNSALQGSAMALAAGLGTAPLQKQLARAVGLDEISFSPGTGDSQGGVVAVGKQISDKIYVTQEFGTTTASNTLRVSYQLSRRWSVRTESGETDAVDLFFTFSFD